MEAPRIPLEIERKYLVRTPDLRALSALPGFSVSEIEQTYLPDPAPGMTERVRLRRYPDRVEYTRTVKTRISPVEAREDETRITEEEYLAYLTRRDPALHTVSKKRITFTLGKQLYEVDLYPFWTRVAVLETELTDPVRSAPIPPFLSVIREVTGDRAYTNRSLARQIPPEPDI